MSPPKPSTTSSLPTRTVYFIPSFFNFGLDVVMRRFDRDAQHLNVLALILFGKLVVVRNFRNARFAPGGPEIDDQ